MDPVSIVGGALAGEAFKRSPIGERMMGILDYIGLAPQEKPAPVEERNPPVMTQARPDTANRNPMIPIDQAPVSPDPMNQGINQDMAGFAQSQSDLPIVQQKVGQRAQQLMQEVPEEKRNTKEAQDGAFALSVAENAQIAANAKDQEGIQNTLKKAFGNEEMWLTLALGFNSMRMRPDAGLAGVIGNRLKTIRAGKAAQAKAPEIAARLKQMGYPQWAKYAMQNPTQAEKVMEQVMQKELKPGAAIKTSGVQIDPTTGQSYVVQSDPNTGDVKRVDIPNAIGLTPQAKADLEASTASNTLDQKTAIEYGQKIFDQAQSINGQIGRLEEVTRAIDAGAVTGPVSQYLPTISKATAQLEAAANSLGIDIINSATFGALSEAELRLALSTGLPQGLPEDELRLWVKDKIAAQKKMRDELFRQAQTLMSGGVRYTEWASNFAKKSLEKSAQESAPAQAPVATPVAPAVQSSDDGFTVKEIR